jgi:hypothetical protein
LDGIFTSPFTTALPATLRISSSTAPMNTKHQPVLRSARRVDELMHRVLDGGGPA